MNKELAFLIKKHEDDKDISFDSNEYSDFSELFYNKLKKSKIMKFYNAKVFIDNLDKIIKYSNSKNMDWITYGVLINRKCFFDILADSLKYYSYPNRINELFKTMYNSLDNVENARKFKILERCFSDKMINALLDLDLESAVYNDIFKYIGSDDIRMFFLQYSFLKKKRINFDWDILNGPEHKYINSHMIAYKIEDNDNNKENSRKKVLNTKVLATDENIKRISEIMVEKFCDLFLKEKNNKLLEEIVELLIKDIVKDNKLKYLDCMFLSSGYYSMVFSIGDKVIKLGNKRGTGRFPNNPYILQPLLRKNIDFNGTNIFIEITEKADYLSDITEEEMYQLYKRLRYLDLVWVDIGYRNIGRLLKDNVVHWDGTLALNDETLGFDKRRGNVTLKAGEVVILDADYIYNKNNMTVDNPLGNTYLIDFEERYQNEKFLNRFKSRSR